MPSKAYSANATADKKHGKSARKKSRTAVDEEGGNLARGNAGPAVQHSMAGKYDCNRSIAYHVNLDLSSEIAAFRSG
jgi:hypothetical protein